MRGWEKERRRWVRSKILFVRISGQKSPRSVICVGLTDFFYSSPLLVHVRRHVRQSKYGSTLQWQCSHDYDRVGFFAQNDRLFLWRKYWGCVQFQCFRSQLCCNLAHVTLQYDFPTKSGAANDLADESRHVWAPAVIGNMIKIIICSVVNNFCYVLLVLLKRIGVQYIGWC